MESFQRDESAERVNARIEMTLQAFQEIARYWRRDLKDFAPRLFQ